MERHAENCMICGKSLVYHYSAQTNSCYICGKSGDSNACCEEGHYICDDCHSERGALAITLEAGSTISKNPVEIAAEIMKNAAISMHGPEHHYLVAASLLAAYKNAGGHLDLGDALQSALQRAKKVPGGVCGFWGSCGAGISTGIFISIITEATPLSENPWSLANRMTSLSLAVIAENGGPRCCKRNTNIAICQAAAFIKEFFGIAFELPQRITCEFSHRNDQCRKNKCLYYTVL